MALARGDARADSDIDVLVIINQKSKHQELQIIDFAYDISLKHGVLLSPLIITMEDYQLRHYLSQEIEREGISL
ncbi:MAG: nucleotidyltransferase domain-containing protein [Firmicutes bacterium]|nr:nucleotidyltransferase domain-containing protein [Bacillota bacterium]